MMEFNKCIHKQLNQRDKYWILWYRHVLVVENNTVMFQIADPKMISYSTYDVGGSHCNEDDDALFCSNMVRTCS
jgi:hypothetical protein